MKILINTATTYKGGGVQVAKSFIEECKKHDRHEYHVILGRMLSQIIDKRSFPDHFKFYDIGYRPATRVFSLKSRDRFFREIEKEIKPDVVFTTSGPAYWRPKAPHLAGYNLPHYIYSDSPYFSKISVLNKWKITAKGAVIKHFFKQDADAYTVQTEDVNNRLKKFLGVDNVFTVSNTYSRYYRDFELFSDKLPQKKEGEFRLLTLSAWYPHKNLGIIPDIIKLLPEEYKSSIRFVVTLPEKILNDQFSKNDRKYILNTGPVRPEEGPSLYRECDAMFLPTLLECFSASYAEAMVMKKPVITTDLGFARSICGDAALYYSALDPGEAASSILSLAGNTQLYNHLVESGLQQLQKFDTPEARAEKYLKICESLAEEILKE